MSASESEVAWPGRPVTRCPRSVLPSSPHAFIVGTVLDVAPLVAYRRRYGAYHADQAAPPDPDRGSARSMTAVAQMTACNR